MTDRFIKFNQEFLDEELPSNPSCDISAYNNQNSLNPISDVLRTDFFTSGGIPSICFLSSSARGSANRPPSAYNSRKKYYHCNSPNDINTTGALAVKNPQTGQTHHLFLRSPCISEDYISSLVKTFNKMTYCFGLSQREARNLFAIINHESQFIPNVQSPTGARCAGQLTKDTVNTLNMNILLGQHPEFHAHQSASNKCPSLIHKTIPPDLHCTSSCAHTLQKGNYDSKKKKLNKYPKTCKLTSNLTQCFLYTFLNFKSAIKTFDHTFRHDNEFGRADAVDERFTDLYGAGLNPNTIIVAENADSSAAAAPYLFTSAKSAYEEVQKHNDQPNNPMYDLNVKTVPLISEKDMDHFKFFSTQLSYNGGSDVIRNQVGNFLSFLKQELEQADCASPNTNKYCKYRQKILKGESLDLSAVKEDFTNFLRRAKNKRGNPIYPREETFLYPKKIKKDIDYFQKSDGVARSHLRKIAPDASPEQIQETADKIKRQCQFPIL